MNAIELRQKNRSLLVASQVQRRSLQARFVGLGSTKATFYVPTGMTPQSASTALVDAVNALLAAYAASGVPSEHAASPEALAVQEAWDLDPVIKAAGTSALLDKDSGYGPNTHDAVASVNGGSAPDVNTGPASTTTSTTVTSTTTSTTTAASDWTRPLLIGVAVVAAAGVTTAAVIHASKKRAARRRQSATTRYPMPHGHRPAYT
jgi:hypothetical protein